MPKSVRWLKRIFSVFSVSHLIRTSVTQFIKNVANVHNNFVRRVLSGYLCVACAWVRACTFWSDLDIISHTISSESYFVTMNFWRDLTSFSYSDLVFCRELLRLQRSCTALHPRAHCLKVCVCVCGGGVCMQNVAFGGALVLVDFMHSVLLRASCPFVCVRACVYVFFITFCTLQSFLYVVDPASAFLHTKPHTHRTDRTQHAVSELESSLMFRNWRSRSLKYLFGENLYPWTLFFIFSTFNS